MAIEPGGGAPLGPERPHETLALLEEWRRGEDRAVERLWERTRLPLLAAIQRRMRTSGGVLSRRVEPEDLLQEAWRIAVERRDQFEDRGPGSFLAWLKAIAAHVAHDAADRHGAERRDARRERSLDGPASDGSGQAIDPPSPAPGPSTRAAASEAERELCAALAALSEHEFAALVLREWEGLEWEAVAGLAGFPSADAARKARARAIAALSRRVR